MSYALLSVLEGRRRAMALVAVSLLWSGAALGQEPELFRPQRPQPLPLGEGLGESARENGASRDGSDDAAKQEGADASRFVPPFSIQPKAESLAERLRVVDPKARSEAAPKPRDALDDVLDRLGGFASWYALGDLRVDHRLTALDERGQALFEQDIQHESRTGFGARRDSLSFEDGLQMGRGTGRVWVRTGGIERPDLEARARHEVAAWALLLHFPFSLRDAERFVVEPKREVMLLGRRLEQIVVAVRDDEALTVGPLPGAAAAKRERWELYVDPKSGLPILAEHVVPSVGRRRILFAKWQVVEGSRVTLPFERTLLAEDGQTPRLLVRLRSR